jgi:hypothetical protein
VAHGVAKISQPQHLEAASQNFSALCFKAQEHLSTSHSKTLLKSPLLLVMSHTYLLELPSKNHHHEGMRLPKLTKAEKPAQPQLATHIETQMNNKPMSSVIIHNLQNNKNTQMQNKTIESIALSININCQNFVMY